MLLSGKQQLSVWLGVQMQCMVSLRAGLVCWTCECAAIACWFGFPICLNNCWVNIACDYSNLNHSNHHAGATVAPAAASSMASSMQPAIADTRSPASSCLLQSFSRCLHHSRLQQQRTEVLHGAGAKCMCCAWVTMLCDLLLDLLCSPSSLATSARSSPALMSNDATLTAPLRAPATLIETPSCSMLLTGPKLFFSSCALNPCAEFVVEGIRGFESVTKTENRIG